MSSRVWNIRSQSLMGGTVETLECLDSSRLFAHCGDAFGSLQKYFYESELPEKQRTSTGRSTQVSVYKGTWAGHSGHLRHDG